MKYLKYILGVLVVVVPCLVTILVYNDKISENSPLYYKQGVEFYNKGDYANAYYNFSKIKWISPLYTMALYKQAKSAQNAGDYKMAAYKYEIFLKKSPDSVFSLNAKINLGKCYYYLKDYDNAKVIFEELYKKNKKSCQDAFYLGLIEKRYDNKEKAEAYLKEYLKAVIGGTAINSTYAYTAAEELSSMNLDLSNEDKKLLGIVYYQCKKYKKALEYFSVLPVSEVWDYLVLSNHYSGNKIVAKKLIENGIKMYSNDINDDNLHEIYDTYASYLVGSRLRNWTHLYMLSKENQLKGQDYIMYKLANISSPEKAVILYKEIVEKFPGGMYAPESLWEVIWYKYKNKEYSNAESLAIKHLRMYKEVKSTPKVLFWLGKIYLNLNRLSDAHNIFNKLSLKYPDNYYGLRAAYIIDRKTDFWTASTHNKIPTKNYDIEFPISLSDIDIKDLKMINTLFEMGDYEIWYDADISNPMVKSWFEYKKNKKSRSIVLARDAIEKMEVKPPVVSGAYKLVYPIYYADEISVAAKKLGLDPFLIMAIIKEESYFNENAVSKTNAVGLMQLMPLTANYVVSKLSMDYTSIDNLSDVRLNLYIGCNYLKYLENRFNNNDLYTIAAYNGGEGAVNKWIKLYNTSDYDAFIEDIPYSETKNYVKKIFRTYHMYKSIYQ